MSIQGSPMTVGLRSRSPSRATSRRIPEQTAATSAAISSAVLFGAPSSFAWALAGIGSPIAHSPCTDRDRRHGRPVPMWPPARHGLADLRRHRGPGKLSSPRQLTATGLPSRSAGAYVQLAMYLWIALSAPGDALPVTLTSLTLPSTPTR